jgi:ferredoxin-NADP reductase
MKASSRSHSAICNPPASELKHCIHISRATRVNMRTGSINIWLGVVFVLIGAINVWLILQSSARVRDAKASARLISAHRIGGYLFLALFCLLGYFMIGRLDDVAAGASPGTMIHLTLAMVLSPLIFVKVLIARYYKNHYSLLMPIGLAIFVLSFVLIGITAGPSLAHQSRIQTVSLAALDLPPAAIDVNLAAATMEKRCSKCHTLDRIAGARKDARGWLSTVNRMRTLPDSGISEADSGVIVSYLASQMVPKDSVGPVGLEVARALVDQRCGRCHSLDRVYKTAESPAEWRATVNRMVDFAEGSGNAFHPGEDQQIIAYLSATQTPDAVSQRKVQVAAASSSGQSLVTQRAAAFPDHNSPGKHYDSRVIVFISLLFLGTLTLVIRRPETASLAGGRLAAPPASEQAGVTRTANPLRGGGALILRLASITQQSGDAKTLRFVVPDDQKLNARAGQFLTFSFLFDGKKVVRSYSICSSPATSGYVEITPKRVRGGCVSVFLNDRAAVGMTVEAKGAFGQFYFDERKHQEVVLLAAGSGITPMMSILRCIDDLCLETTVTLLYCVRTSDDVIFQAVLDELRARLRNFQFHLMLSQPPVEWTGPRGHVSREFIEHAVTNLLSVDFFLCGPPQFMETSRGILAALGVKPERILQESFGGTVSKSAKSISLAVETGVSVEFARSGKTCTIGSGQTLLEAAESNGVVIPSSCRQGQCGTCKIRLLAGSVRMDAEDGLDPHWKAQGFVLTCVGHAENDVKLDA